MAFPPNQEHVLNDRLPPLSALQRTDLERGKVVLMGNKGKYAVLAKAQVTAAIAWAVMTDYNRFHEFLPTVAQSRVIEMSGPRAIVEQIDRRQILLSTMESRVLTENFEMEGRQISFRMLEGDLDYMYGHWRIEPSTESVDEQGVVLSQQVWVESNLGPFKNMFYTLFAESLVDTMKAMRTEMERRSVSSPCSSH